MTSVAVEQVGATLARWFSGTAATLPQVVPNLGTFPVTDLGFLA